MDIEEYDDELDEEFAPRPKARLGAATIALAALLVAGLGFVVGVYVQKHDGPTDRTTNTTAAAFASRARTGGFGGGTGGGGTGGGGTAVVASAARARPPEHRRGRPQAAEPTQPRLP